MKLIRKAFNPSNQLFRGVCRICMAEFEAHRSELKVERCLREHYEFAHADCSECNTKAGNAVILYPKK